MKEMYISKEQTLQLKGIAILLMLCLHLFMNAGTTFDDIINKNTIKL